ncbi:MAG: matrixin family metalloprotease, partial [Alphaproteobacteria bacterium]|nr:matrixin family metalloprotease [Alphaproteobacteria bacterium]
MEDEDRDGRYSPSRQADEGAWYPSAYFPVASPADPVPESFVVHAVDTAPPPDGAEAFVRHGTAKWGAAGSPTSGGIVTWSVMGAGIATGFGGTSVAMSVLGLDYTTIIKSAFDAWAAVANVKFAQVADPGTAGTSAYVADIRLAAEYIDGNNNILAQAYYPTANGGTQSPLAGNVRIDSGDSFTYQELFLTMLHEIGHSLGLEHEPTNLAIMNPYLNTSLSGLQTDDINGISAIYGAATGAALAYTMPEAAGTTPLAIVNGFNGAIYNGNSLANAIAGGGWNETMTGQGGNDTLAGLGGDDVLAGGSGNDWLLGGTGTDTAVFSGNRSGYTLTMAANGDVTVVGTDGTDRVQEVEFLQFADQVVAVSSLAAPVLPDLWSYVALDRATVAAGGSATVTAYVVNQGTGASAGSTTGFYLSTDAVITTSDTLLATKVSPGLAPLPGAGYYDLQSFALTLSSGLSPGTYWIGGIADHGNAVSESNEANNNWNA